MNDVNNEIPKKENIFVNMWYGFLFCTYGFFVNLGQKK